MAKPDLVGIAVEHMPRALAFYRMLGLEIPPEMDAEDHVEFVTEGGFRLAWDTVELIESFSGTWTKPVGHRMGLAFVCDTPADVDALYAQAIERGVTGLKAPWDAFWGQRYATLQDPDGNPVDLYAWLPSA